MIFYTIEKYFRVLGIFTAQFPNVLQNHPFIFNNTTHRLFVNSSLLFSLLSTFAFIIFEARTFEEFAQPSAFLVAISPLIGCFWAFIRDKENIVRLINVLKQTVSARE